MKASKQIKTGCDTSRGHYDALEGPYQDTEGSFVGVRPFKRPIKEDKSVSPRSESSHCIDFLWLVILYYEYFAGKDVWLWLDSTKTDNNTQDQESKKSQ